MNEQTCLALRFKLNTLIRSNDLESFGEFLSMYKNNIVPIAEGQDQWGECPLVTAGRYGRDIIVKQFLLCGVHVDAVQNNGRDNGFTGLEGACRAGHFSTASEFINHGANVNHTDDRGYFSLCQATTKGHNELVKLLLSNKAMPDKTSKTGNSCLMYASFHGFANVVQTLLHFGAAINLQNKNLVSSLLLASYKGRQDVVEILLKNGAKIDLKSKQGNTCIGIATKYGHQDIEKILRNYQANLIPKHMRGKGEQWAAEKQQESEKSKAKEDASLDDSTEFDELQDFDTTGNAAESRDTNSGIRLEPDALKNSFTEAEEHETLPEASQANRQSREALDDANTSSEDYDVTMSIKIHGPVPHFKERDLEQKSSDGYCVGIKTRVKNSQVPKPSDMLTITVDVKSRITFFESMIRMHHLRSKSKDPKDAACGSQTRTPSGLITTAWPYTVHVEPCTPEFYEQNNNAEVGTIKCILC